MFLFSLYEIARHIEEMGNTLGETFYYNYIKDTAQGLQYTQHTYKSSWKKNKNFYYGKASSILL